MTAEKKRFVAALCILLVYVLWGMTGCSAEQSVGFPVSAAVVGGADRACAAHHMAVVPEAIWEKVRFQPDTMEYAALYYAFGQADLDTDISADVTAGEVPLLLQWDKRWGYEMYGTNFMGINGCAPTALAMVYVGLTGSTDVTPYDLARYAMAHGLYVSGQGTKWSLMETGGRHLGLKVQKLWKDENAIRKALADGKLMTVRVGAGDFTDGGHFLVICGIDEHDMLTIRDPNSREKTAQPWAFERVMEQASCFWSFEK
ncbi:MAG: C39 family peptidase [Oscillospiraceae bacterium]|nr:C39 family peptidase [Oscillospiraceae bacterium]